MKKLILFISFVFCFFLSFGQIITTNTGGTQGRSGRSIMVEDFNLSARANFTAPRFNDTTQANENVYIISGGQWDTCGRLIYTVDVNGYWVRVCRPSKHWERVGASTILNPNCGLATGTGIVTWDSLLTFDVSAANYALCCDNIPRSTLDTIAILDSNDADFQRIDAIILDSNGVNVVRGEPSDNPSTPSTDNCQIVLAYVLINAHDSVPAFITPTNPGVIYDENTYDTFFEWQIDSVSNVTADTADIAHPVHGTKDIYVSSYTTGGYMIFTAPQHINLNNYSQLKLYLRKTTNTVVRLDFVWYLDGQQATTIISRTIPATGANVYNTILVPLNSFNIFNTDEVNKLKIIIAVGDAQPLYFDWIQLQGIGTGGSTTTGIESVNVLGNNIISPSTSSPNGPNVVTTLTLSNQAPFTVFRQQSNVDSIPVFGKLDLSQNYFTGTLNPIYIQPSDSNGYVLTTIDGMTVWKAVNQDTTWVHNWIRREVSDTSDNDTLSFGSRDPDSSLLSFDTYVGTNGHFFKVQEDKNTIFILDPANGDYAIGDFDHAVNGTGVEVLDAGKLVSIFSAPTGLDGMHLDMQNDAGGDGRYLDFTADISSTPTHLFTVDISNGFTLFKNDSIRLESTLPGANSGYVWTLADPTTGSGYWGVGGGATRFAVAGEDDAASQHRTFDLNDSTFTILNGVKTQLLISPTVDSLYGIGDLDNQAGFISINNAFDNKNIIISAGQLVAIDRWDSGQLRSEFNWHGAVFAGSSSFSYVFPNNTYDVTPTDFSILCQNGTYTVTIPDAAGDVSNGRIIVIKNTGAGTITVDTHGGNIDGISTATLIAGKSIVVQSNGSNWFIIAGY